MDKPKAIFSRKFLRKPRCDAIRCVALRVPDVVGVELGNPIKKFNRQSLLYSLYLFARYSYLSHSLTLSAFIYLCPCPCLTHYTAMWAQFKWLPVYELCILTRGELLRSKLKIIRFFFFCFFFCSLLLSFSVRLSPSPSI